MCCGLDPAWLWLWPASVALIRPLAWEPPYAVDAALKSKKKKKKKEIKEIILGAKTAGNDHKMQKKGQIHKEEGKESETFNSNNETNFVNRKTFYEKCMHWMYKTDKERLLI